MIIASSNVFMSSNREFKTCSHVETETKFTPLLELKDDKTVIFRRPNSINSINSTSGVKRTESNKKSEEDLKLTLLMKILDSIKRNTLKSEKNKEKALGCENIGQDYNEDSFDFSGLQGSTNIALNFMGVQVSNKSLIQRADGVVGTAFTKDTYINSTYEESETTSFSAIGTVVTDAGRQIDFGISLEMSRSFYSEYEEYNSEQVIFTDPLVINFDTDETSLSDQKFFFDLDSDGENESISFVGNGSGFLALDKNGDGIINDGNELFGTKSGDGFKDLSYYDADKNGFIDEADDIFKRLKVWTKDENGNDKLFDLKELGIGAIYLGSSNTQFSLTDEMNNTNAIIRKTGLFIKESGDVGTVHHLDLAR